MISILMPLIAAAVMISPDNSNITPIATTSSSGYFLNERVKPSGSLMEKFRKMNILTAIKNREKKTETENPNAKIALKIPIVQALQVTIPPAITPAAVNTVYPQDINYEEIYKTAGEKYGIPWQILFGLHKTETGCRNGPIFNNAGSGAQGPMQFMPGTWRAYGVDGDGDGASDINNAIDAIHGAANYLAKHGSLENGLRAYGGNYSGTLAYASEKGFSL